MRQLAKRRSSSLQAPKQQPTWPWPIWIPVLCAGDDGDDHRDGGDDHNDGGDNHNDGQLQVLWTQSEGTRDEQDVEVQ